MKPSAHHYLLWVCAVWVLFWGCHTDTPKADPMPADQSMQLLRQLTSTNEAERFKVQAQAIEDFSDISRRELETVLTSLRKKNVSTLIYACIKTRSEVLYGLNPPATMVLESAAGAFPNIAYYYARVKPSAGLQRLIELYHRNPDRRLPICLALGEVDLPQARSFLLAEARKIKSTGHDVYAQLCGLKGAAGNVTSGDVLWMLEQKLGREEVIALAEVDVRLTDTELKAIWQSGAVKRNYALQRVLGNPDAYFDVLNWIIDQYLKNGNSDMVRQLLLSDSMRTSSSKRVKQYRETILKKIGTSNHT